MLNLEVATLPAASCAVQVTTSVPSGKTLPETGAHETATLPSTMSVAVGRLYVTVAPLWLVASIVRFEWAEIAGGVESWTTAWNVDVDVFPALSVAEHVIVVVPIASVVPEAGAH